MRTHTELATNRSLLAWGARFVRKPWREKLQAIGFHWVKRVPWVPFPVRLPFGGWWLAWDDAVDHQILAGSFETPLRCFVERFLKPGMTVLDIGAHHGFYTLLASKKVGPMGVVVAFEPSPRERKKLLWHLRLHGCKNVRVEGLALASTSGERTLFLVERNDTGCNSLRPPNAAGPSRAMRVSITTVDEYIREHEVRNVDFVKLDVEGAEREILSGACELLRKEPRPVFLCELQDIRTQAWGHRAADVAEFLARCAYRWYEPCPDGTIQQEIKEFETLDGTYVAVPEERIQQMLDCMARQEDAVRKRSES